MQSITLKKLEGVAYRPWDFKSYEALRGSEVVGTIGQDFSMKWEVVNLNFESLSAHTTIKAALRVAGRVL